MTRQVTRHQIEHRKKTRPARCSLSRQRRRPFGNDSIFHEGHNHYHIENFASYRLLQDGEATNKKGTKTSFCVIDWEQVSGSNSQQYTSCDKALQGLTVGWGDTYHANLDDQWVDLGTTPLADGNYTLQSTADPRNMLVESNDNNNTASTCFTVAGGEIFYC